MKLTHVLTGLLGLALVQGANAADISVYYSPTCPHCHHAREFISSELIYVYNDLKVTQIDVTNPDNQQEFMDTLKKCEYESGGVPVLVIGEKCFQGYADSMQDELRAAVEIDLSDEQKQAAKDNKAAFDGDKEAFVAAHADRTSAIVEREVKKKLDNEGEAAKTNTVDKYSKNYFDTTNIALFGTVLLLIIGMGLLFRKRK